MPNTNSSKPTSTFFDFHPHDDTSFLKTLSTRNSRFLATDKCIVNLNSTTKFSPANSNHCRTDLMQPGPSSFVTSEPKKSFQSCCTSTCFLGTDPPHSDKPHPQGLPGTLKNRPRCQRGLMMAGRAFNQVSFVHPSMMVPTSWTSESVRPSERHQIRPASFLRGKLVLELQLRFRKIPPFLIHHTDGISQTVT